MVTLATRSARLFPTAKTDVSWLVLSFNSLVRPMIASLRPKISPKVWSTATTSSAIVAIQTILQTKPAQQRTRRHGCAVPSSARW